MNVNKKKTGILFCVIIIIFLSLVRINAQTENNIYPSLMSGTNGWTLTASYGACYETSFSDTNARIYVTFHINIEGTFCVRIEHFGSGNNLGREASGKLYVGSWEETEGFGGAYNVINGGNFDLTLDNIDVLCIDESVHFNVMENDTVLVSFEKDDNAGGSGGLMRILQIILVCVETTEVTTLNNNTIMTHIFIMLLIIFLLFVFLCFKTNLKLTQNVLFIFIIFLCSMLFIESFTSPFFIYLNITFMILTAIIYFEVIYNERE